MANNKSLKDIINLTNQGIISDSYIDIVDTYKKEMQKIYGNDIDLSQASADGQYVMLMSQLISNLTSIVSTMYKSLDTDVATGSLLDVLCAQSNVFREQASRATTNVLLCWKSSTSKSYKPGEFSLYNAESNTTWFNTRDFTLSKTNLPIIVESNDSLIWTINGESDNYYIDENGTVALSTLQVNRDIYSNKVVNVDGYLAINNNLGDSENYHIIYTKTGVDNTIVPLEFEPIQFVEMRCQAAGSFGNCDSLIDYDVYDNESSYPILTSDNYGAVSSIISADTNLIAWQLTDATDGTDIENDESLRSRKNFIDSSQGATTVTNMRNELINLYGIKDCAIINNNTTGDIASVDILNDKSSLTLNRASVLISLRYDDTNSPNSEEIAETIYENLSLGCNTTLVNGDTPLTTEKDTRVEELINNGELNVTLLKFEYDTALQKGLSLTNLITWKKAGKIDLNIEFSFYVKETVNLTTLKNTIVNNFKTYINDLSMGEKLVFKNLYSKATKNSSYEIIPTVIKVDMASDITINATTITKDDNFICALTDYLKVGDNVELTEEDSSLDGYKLCTLTMQK